MQFLALLRTSPDATPDRLGPLIRPEAEKVWHLHQTGALRTAHFIQAADAPFPQGVTLTFEADTAARAQAMMDDLPMVAEGLIDVEILPLAPFTAYSALFGGTPVSG
jgi:hypothetical protein